MVEAEAEYRKVSHPSSATFSDPAANIDEEDNVQEGGWGWMIVASNFLMMTLFFGFGFSLPVFFLEWMQYFDATATEISWVISLYPALKGILSPVAGVLCTRFGSRKIALIGCLVVFVSLLASVFSRTVWHLCITVGVLPGAGGALIFSPSLVMLGHYFKKRYVFANSIAFLGFGCAQLLVPRFAQFLKEAYGWRGALLILSSIECHLFVCATLLRTKQVRKPPLDQLQKAKDFDTIYRTRDIGTSTSSLHMFDNMCDLPTSAAELRQERYQRKKTHKQHRKCTLFKVFRTSVVNAISYIKDTYGLSVLGKSVFYISTLIGSFLGGVGWFATNGHLVARAVTAGISPNNAALLITVIGLSSIVGRAGHGILIDKGFVSRDVMFIGAFTVTAIVTFINPLLDTFLYLCFISALFGFFHGVANSLVFAMMRVQVGSKEAAAALSVGSLTQALANTLGGVLEGWLFDVTGNYIVSFIFAGTSILSGAILLFLVLIVYKRYKYKTRQGLNQTDQIE